MLCRYVLTDQLLLREVLPPAALELLTSTLVFIRQAGKAPGSEDASVADQALVPQQAALLVAQVRSGVPGTVPALWQSQEKLAIASREDGILDQQDLDASGYCAKLLL